MQSGAGEASSGEAVLFGRPHSWLNRGRHVLQPLPAVLLVDLDAARVAAEQRRNPGDGLLLERGELLHPVGARDTRPRRPGGEQFTAAFLEFLLGGPEAGGG